MCLVIKVAIPRSSWKLFICLPLWKPCLSISFQPTYSGNCDRPPQKWFGGCLRAEPPARPFLLRIRTELKHLDSLSSRRSCLVSPKPPHGKSGAARTGHSHQLPVEAISACPQHVPRQPPSCAPHSSLKTPKDSPLSPA